MFYIVLRDTLDAGQVAAQTAHVTSAFATEHPAVLGGWHTGEGSVVVLSAPGDALPRLRDEFASDDVPAASFCEPDLGGAMTAVAVACERTHPLVRRRLRRLPLAGRPAGTPTGTSLSPLPPYPSGSGP